MINSLLKSWKKDVEGQSHLVEEINIAKTAGPYVAE